MDKLTIEAVVHPTEDEEKVSEAMRNLFGDIVFKVTRHGGEHLVSFEGDDPAVLSQFKRQLANEQIRDAARSLMLRNIEGNCVRFSLNKQAAYARRISFYSSGESALGPINVTISSEDPTKILQWLTAKTEPIPRRQSSKKRRQVTRADIRSSIFKKKLEKRI